MILKETYNSGGKQNLVVCPNLHPISFILCKVYIGILSTLKHLRKWVLFFGLGAYISLFGITGSSHGFAQVPISLDSIAHIESSNNPLAKSNRPNDPSYGLYQITPIALEDYCQFNKDCPSEEDLFDPVVSHTIASWMFSKRIPQLLKHFNEKVNIDNMLTAYNCGIGCVVKGKMPAITRNYIKKYKALEAQK